MVGSPQFDDEGSSMEIIGLIASIFSILGVIYMVVIGGDPLLMWWKQRTRGKSFLSSKAFVKTYLQALIADIEFLDFRGIQEEVATRLSVKLTDVFVPTSVESPDLKVSLVPDPVTGVMEVEKHYSVLLSSLLDNSPRAILLGEAGAGKSTFFRYITLTIADAILSKNKNKALQELQVSWPKLPIPVYAPLRELAYISTKSKNESYFIEILLEYFSDLTGEVIPPVVFESTFQENVLVLLDGLDEISDFDQRSVIIEKIEHFLKRYPNTICWISCRPTAYYGSARLGSDFKLLEVQSFSQEQIGNFVRRWYTEVEKHNVDSNGSYEKINRSAKIAADDLLVSLRKSETLNLLAANPLILTAIVIVHYSKTKLPERRAELFETCVQALLGGWDIAKRGLGAKKLMWPASDSFSIKARRTQLEYIALGMSQNKVISLSEREVLEILSQDSPKFRDEPNAKEQAQKFIDAIAQRGGLFTEYQSDRYRFVHRSFQDYLAGRRIGRLDKYREFVHERLSDNWWDDSFRLAIAYQSARDPERAQKIIEEILAHISELPQGRALLLASESLFESDRTTLPLSLQTDVTSKLLSQMEKKNIDLKLRFRMGILAGLLGDPRDLTEMVLVSGGEYKIYDEHDDFLVTELHPFKISKYPVTNSEFQKFINERCYENPKHWSASGWEWKNSMQIDCPFYWRDAKFNSPNQPVVGVSWYEAQAYANWIGKRLPSELEWQASAAGPSGFTWPWGNEFIEFACNHSSLNLHAPSPVGIFRNTSRSSEIFDLSGNVWEWTLSAYTGQSIIDLEHGDVPGAARILKGGSWFGNWSDTKTSNRRWLNPGARQFNFGFRLAEGKNDL